MWWRAVILTAALTWSICLCDRPPCFYHFFLVSPFLLLFSPPSLFASVCEFPSHLWFPPLSLSLPLAPSLSSSLIHSVSLRSRRWGLTAGKSWLTDWLKPGWWVLPFLFLLLYHLLLQLLLFILPTFSTFCFLLLFLFNPLSSFYPTCESASLHPPPFML